MQTATHSERLVVWTEPKALDEATSLYAPYAPRFQAVPCHVKSGLSKAQVSALYLSRPEEDAAVESTLATLRNCNVSTLLVFTPHHSADFAFRVGTMVGRQKFAEAEWAFNWPYLRQLLKARNIRVHARPKGDEKSTFDLQKPGSPH